MKIIFITIVSSILFMSCLANTEGLEVKYKEFIRSAETLKPQLFLKEIDKMSLSFINEMSEVENMSYSEVLRIGEKYQLKLLCTKYWIEYGQFVKVKNKSDSYFFTYLVLNYLPILQNGADLVKSKTNYFDQTVTIARATIKKNTYITSEISIVKSDGEFKVHFLDVLSLFEMLLKRNFYSYKLQQQIENRNYQNQFSADKATGFKDQYLDFLQNSKMIY